MTQYQTSEALCIRSFVIKDKFPSRKNPLVKKKPGNTDNKIVYFRKGIGGGVPEGKFKN
jgi:hypothetical protein